MEPLVGPRLDLVEDRTQGAAFRGQRVEGRDRRVLLEPAVHEPQLLEVVEDPRKRPGTGVGGAFELVEPLFTLLEVMKHDQPPLGPDLFYGVDDRTGLVGAVGRVGFRGHECHLVAFSSAKLQTLSVV